MNISGAGLGLLAALALQSGTLIWFLSRINTELQYINKALSDGKVKIGGHTEDLTDVKTRLSFIEQSLKQNNMWTEND